MPARKLAVGAKRRVGVRRQRGAGFFGDLWSGIKKAATFVKDNKLISKGLGAAGLGKYQGFAQQLGLGKRRAAPRKRAQRGRGQVMKF
jgi:hypothetical protein